MKNRRPVKKERRRGSAALEFALSSLLIMSVLTVVFPFGYSFYVYNKLEGSVAAGARFASRLTYDSPSTTPSQTYNSAVTNLVVYGNPTGGAEPVIPGLSPSNVELTISMENGVPARTRVAIVNFDIASARTWRLNGKPFAEFRYMGRFAP